MKLQLWLVSETPRARLFKRSGPGVIVSRNVDEVWIPRSVCKSMVKFPPLPGLHQPRCEVEVADWFVERQNLGTSAIP